MKDILVFSDGGSHDDAGMRHAEALAKSFDAKLTVLELNSIHIQIPVISSGMSPDLAMGAMMPLPEDPADIAAREARQAAMEARFAGKGDAVRLVRIDETSGALADAAVRVARTKDLAVVMLPPDDGSLPGLFDRLLMESGHGVLGVPSSYEGPMRFERVVIGWNGSLECARAVTQAMPILKQASAVTVVVVDQDRMAGEELPDTLEIVRHLQAHGVRAEWISADSGSLKTSQALLAEARRLDAHLIVAGAQTSGGFLQWLTGSVSRELLVETHIPLLIAH
jgi:nucleotide-binding universal stress UspA family protein